MMHKSESVVQPKDYFRNDVLSTLQDANIKIFSEQLWGVFEETIYPRTPSWYGFYERLFPVIAVVHHQNIEIAYRLLQKNMFRNITFIATSSLYIIYFENHYRLPGIPNGIILYCVSHGSG